MRDDFHEWLVHRGYKQNTVAARYSNVVRLESHQDVHLDTIFEKQGFRQIFRSLEYTIDDKLAGRYNDSGIEIHGDFYTGLATLRSALRLYEKFLKEARN